MRQTCARVLAAALMTGAIATAMGLPSLFESGGDPGRGLTAPPSSLQRSVRSPAPFAPARPASALQRPALSGERSARVRLGPSRPAVSAPRSTTRPAGAGQSPLPVPAPKPEPMPEPTQPAPAPEPEPETRELASTSTTPAAPAPAPAPEPERGKKKPKGNGHGNGKVKTKAAPEAPPAEGQPPAATPEPADEPEGNEHGNGKDNGKGHGKDREK